MRIIDLTLKDFYNELKHATYYGAGDTNVCLFLRDKTFIKIDERMYKAMKANSFFQGFKKVYNNILVYQDNFDKDLIESLSRLQPEITLTKFPLGVIQVDSHVEAILPFFYKNYLELYRDCPKNYELVRELLLNVLLTIHELDEYGISYTDIDEGRNIFYKGTEIALYETDEDIQITDSPSEIEMMYHEFQILIIALLRQCGKYSESIKKLVEYLENVRYIVDYTKAEEIIKRL